MEEIVIIFILKCVKDAVSNAIEEGITYVIKKVVDGAGNVVTKIVHEFDSDGDGEIDSEQEIYTLQLLIPDLSNGYCLCNRGNEIGLGLPQFKLLDGTQIWKHTSSDILLLDEGETDIGDLLPDIGDILPDVGDFFAPEVITGNDNGYILDLDDDGENDDVLIPLPDFTGDGVGDWGWLVDDDDNGLPDVSPDSPFYPVGSEEYDYILERSGVTDNSIMTKRTDKYSVTEALLALILLFTFIDFVRGLFRRSDYLR